MKVQFPETAIREWQAAASSSTVAETLRARVERDVLVEREVERLRIRHEANVLFQQERDSLDTPPLEMMTLTDFKTRPDQTNDDLIYGAVADNAVVSVVGPSRSGKTTLALQFIHSLATGTPWLGQPVKKIAGGFGVLSFDMAASRVLDWVEGYPGVRGDRVSVVNAYQAGNPLGVPSMRAQIAAAWRAARTEVVIVDSFSASFFGRDQNDAAGVMDHYRDLKKFALAEVGARLLVVIVHSTASRPGAARGSTVHMDTPDNVITVVPDDSGNRVVRVEKYREYRGESRQMSPVVLSVPDDTTHLVTLNLGAMNLAGFDIPKNVAGSVFAPFPASNQSPDVSDHEEA